jgi:hypothetical protein
MMCPDHRAVDHVGSAIAACHFRQGFEHRVEHPGLHPSAVAPEHAVPLAIFIGKVTPLRACPGHPHHAFKIQPVVMSGATTSAPLRWQERANQCPFLVRHTNPLAQRRLPKDSLESTSESPVKLCPRNLVWRQGIVMLQSAFRKSPQRVWFMQISFVKLLCLHPENRQLEALVA